MKQKELIEVLQKTIAMQTETIKALLSMVAELKQPLLTVAPVPPVFNPWPPYQPYIGTGANTQQGATCSVHDGWDD